MDPSTSADSLQRREREMGYRVKYERAKFKSNVSVGNHASGTGEGSTKQEAKNSAAQNALDKLKADFTTELDDCISRIQVDSDIDQTPMGTLKEFTKCQGLPSPKYKPIEVSVTAHAGGVTCTKTGSTKQEARNAAAEGAYEELTGTTSRRLDLSLNRDASNTERKILSAPAESNFSEDNVSTFYSEFNCIECLGEGAYGKVLRAEKKIDGKHYAVKRIDFTQSESLQDEALREVELLAMFEHENIVRYFHAWKESTLAIWQKERDQRTPHRENSDKASGSSTSGEEDEEGNDPTKRKKFLYIQMQLCSKGSLEEWLGKNIVDRDQIQILIMCEEISSAVSYIHGKGVMHRDLKPGNIFLTENESVRVGDFGFAKLLEQDNHSGGVPFQSSMAHTDYKGTESYMSPEQLAKKDYGQKTDIFSLGLVYLELWLPFSTGMEKQKTFKTAREQSLPPDFRKKNPFESNLVYNMLSKDPENRPDATRVYEDLRRRRNPEKK